MFSFLKNYCLSPPPPPLFSPPVGIASHLHLRCVPLHQSISLSHRYGLAPFSRSASPITGHLRFLLDHAAPPWHGGTGLTNSLLTLSSIHTSHPSASLGRAVLIGNCYGLTRHWQLRHQDPSRGGGSGSLVGSAYQRRRRGLQRLADMMEKAARC
jgi:hypothetical protein